MLPSSRASVETVENRIISVRQLAPTKLRTKKLSSRASGERLSNGILSVHQLSHTKRRSKKLSPRASHRSRTMMRARITKYKTSEPMRTSTSPSQDAEVGRSGAKRAAWVAYMTVEKPKERHGQEQSRNTGQSEIGGKSEEEKKNLVVLDNRTAPVLAIAEGSEPKGSGALSKDSLDAIYVGFSKLLALVVFGLRRYWIFVHPVFTPESGFWKRKGQNLST